MHARLIDWICDASWLFCVKQAGCLQGNPARQKTDSAYVNGMRERGLVPDAGFWMRIPCGQWNYSSSFHPVHAIDFKAFAFPAEWWTPTETKHRQIETEEERKGRERARATATEAAKKADLRCLPTLYRVLPPGRGRCLFHQVEDGASSSFLHVFGSPFEKSVLCNLLV